MGLLYLGTPLTWDEAMQYADHVREHGITQFLHTWDRVKDRWGDQLLWGDEVEYMVVTFDDEEKNAKLSLRQTEILVKLNQVVGDLTDDDTPAHVTVPAFHPEYGKYMLESTPGSPYTSSISSLLSVETNMHYRRTLTRKHLKANEIPFTFTSFPRLGTRGVFTEPHHSSDDAKSSYSLFLAEEITSPHPRFPIVVANTRSRRGSKIAINLPIFIDKRTPRPFVDPTIPLQCYPEDPEAKNGVALIDHIYMDASGFGFGCCCLQLTFQSCNVGDARRMYDALVPVGPIMLALTAASPAWRGYLADVDCRWNVIAGSADDRTPEERGLNPSKDDYIIPKSRYDSVDLYISNDWINKPEYNDVPAPYDKGIFQRLCNHGIDEMLAKHIAHLFIRDPLVILSEAINQDDTTSNHHFESIQSTNWQTVRFKPPPPNSPIGWRVEFRPMEVQMTDFENAAFAVFIVLLSRAILAFNLNFYIPISKVDQNMARAQRRDAARSVHLRAVDHVRLRKLLQRRRNYFAIVFSTVPRPLYVKDGPIEDEYEEMTMEEIFVGKGSKFPGLLGVVKAYLDILDVDEEDRLQISKYLDLVRRRAIGSLQTPATWIRNFVRSHPSYNHDSVVSQEINYDLMVAVDEIERGVRRVPELLPEDYTPTKGYHSKPNGP
ncbi:glutamate-cysteine ligase catalytic subunit [Suillus subalutaceus]|uniref:glutamate-cysteine ligase catalytic subunit n=1 Tax=Suillus subalutaceus TaxID=48586 RepID=UPI001B86DDAD|nr:glutamate-cysteine ligase catalytic subunit [Suillus subalutaceus]KAG1827846.1 glutamate-cysteine ligase catalytic subunit [Suillus subalutaceus]